VFLHAIDDEIQLPDWFVKIHDEKTRIEAPHLLKIRILKD
jgi:hypothetical protein